MEKKTDTFNYGDKEYDLTKISPTAKVLYEELQELNPQLEAATKAEQQAAEVRVASGFLVQRLGIALGHFDEPKDDNESEDSGN